MISLLYVSRAALQAGSADRQMMEILETARKRNAAAGVTGALICVNGHFAQVLEGEAPAVNQLMIDILRDRRHSEVRIIEVAPVRERRFEGWSMAWVPPAPAPREHLDLLSRAGTDAETNAAARALIGYMIQYAGASDS